jgi:molybdopterin molybdotransferase
VSEASAQVVGFAEALELVLRHAAKVGLPEQERVPLLASAGRVLAEGVVADRDQPPFDRATRDGFAVRAAEWSGGARLRVAGQVRAGEEWAGGEVAAGCAVEIMTGAAVPRGADAVAMVEHAEDAGGEVWASVGRKLQAGENIVPRGSEARRGEAVLTLGTQIGAAEIALAAGCGCVDLAVYERPTVAIVATGDELVELDQTPEAQQIRNSNSYALAAMVEAAGGEARRLGIARDTLEDVRARIDEGRGSELLILSGGVSAGKYDLVEEVLAEFGAEFFFTGVRMQPGKPVVFGRMPKSGERPKRTTEILSPSTAQNDASIRANGASVGTDGALAGPDQNDGQQWEWTYFFGLPGNPVSTQVTFHCFVEPMLRAMCGVGVGGPKFVQATLAEDVRGKAGLTRILPARLRFDFDRPEVRLVGWQGSGDLAANARANCYAVLPDGLDLRAGDVITVLLR